jgi:hypothetical protein
MLSASCTSPSSRRPPWSCCTLRYCPSAWEGPQGAEKVQNRLTDNDKGFCGGEGHPYQIYLKLNDVERRNSKVRQPQTNSFAESFNRTALGEFFQEAVRKQLYEAVEALQRDLDKCITTTIPSRPGAHQGYRSMGRRHTERVKEYLKEVRKDA